MLWSIKIVYIYLKHCYYNKWNILIRGKIHKTENYSEKKTKKLKCNKNVNKFDHRKCLGLPFVINMKMLIFAPQNSLISLKLPLYYI